jgi:hypothetical protein
MSEPHPHLHEHTCAVHRIIDDIESPGDDAGEKLEHRERGMLHGAALEYPGQIAYLMG